MSNTVELRVAPTTLQAGDTALVNRGGAPAMVAMGTAAAAGAGDFATAAQGARADTALQPGAQIPWADVTGQPALFDGTWASLSGKPATFAPAPHTHAITEVIGLQTALNGKAGTATFTASAAGLVPAAGSGGTDRFLRADGQFVAPPGSGGAGTVGWTDVTDKPEWTATFDGSYGALSGTPTTFPPAPHGHTIAQIADFPNLAPVATSGAYGDLSGRPMLGTAAAANVGDFASAAQGQRADTALQPGAEIPWPDVTGKPATFPPQAHTHSVAQITDFPALAPVATSGAYADLSGRPNLGSAATRNVGPGANEVAAGNHGHAIADVTGLQGVLDGKQATLVSGTTLKTVNGVSLLGSGNISVEGGSGGGLGDVRAVRQTDAGIPARPDASPWPPVFFFGWTDPSPNMLEPYDLWFPIPAPSGAGEAPVITSAGTISGTATVGGSLSVTGFSATGDPMPTLTYQWLRNGASIAGATSAAYTLVSADEGASISRRTTATNTAGSVSAGTPPVTVVAAVAPPGSVSVVQTGAVYNSGLASTGTVPLSLPRAPAAGNLLVAVVSAGSTSNTFTPPAGWSTAVFADHSRERMIVIYKVAGPGEPASIQVGVNPDRQAAGVLFECEGVSVRGALSWFGGTASSSTFTLSPATSVPAGSLIFAAIGSSGANDWQNTWTNGFTRLVASGATNAPAFTVAMKVTEAAGPVSTTETRATAARAGWLMAAFDGAAP